jgi:hypothetical protein
MSALLRDVRENEEFIIEDRSREIRRFALTSPIGSGTKRG